MLTEAANFLHVGAIIRQNAPPRLKSPFRFKSLLPSPNNTLLAQTMDVR